MATEPDDYEMDRQRLEAITLSLPGVRLEPVEGHGWPPTYRRIVTLPETVDAALATDLVERLPDGLAYGYWDMAHPSPSDPGAHTYLWRDAQGLALGLGNHGWSTKASRLGADEAALHLQIALAGPRAQGEPRLVLCVADFPWLLGRRGRVAKQAHKTLRARLEAMRDQRASAGR